MPEQLAELFSSRMRAAVLSLVLPRPHLAFSLTDLSRRLDLPVSSLQHECYKLARLGVLRDARVRNARLYRPDPTWPLLLPLTALVVRSMPVEEVLSAAIELVPGIDEMWVAGDFAKRSAPVFLVVVGRLDVESLDAIFDRARVGLVPAAKSGQIELAYYRPPEWEAKLAASEPFAASLVAARQMRIRSPERELGHRTPNGDRAA